jgi:hypothetical protein
MKQVFKQADNRELGVLAKRGMNIVYNIIPKSRECLTINCVMNAARDILPGFYIFKGE